MEEIIQNLIERVAVLERDVQELKQSCNVKHKETFDILKSNTNLDLSLTAEQQLMFDKAVDAGLMISVGKGSYRWLSSKALLSYFCGRVFCGDYPEKNGDGTFTWECGKGRFPEKKVEQLFSEKNIGKYHRNRVLLVAPNNHKKVDNLWL